MEATELTARDLIATWAIGRKHRRAATCPKCQQDVSRVGITKIVYSMEPCECGKLTYEHLVEQLWHRTCFLTANVGRANG